MAENMTETMEKVNLTLDVQDAPEAVAVAPLEVDTTPEMVAVDKQAVESEVAATTNNFTEEEKQQIKDFAEKIDLTDANAILGYGASAQKKMSDFSEAALETVKAKDMGEIGDMLTKLMVELKHDPTEKKGFFANLFGRGAMKIEEIKSQYSTAEKNVDNVAKVLEQHKETLARDIALLDKQFDKNKLFFKELSMYIEAGKLKLERARKVELPEYEAKAKASNLPEDTQAAQDYAAMIDRFEKKLYDLEATRTICLQNAPQIRLIQNNDIILSDKIHSAIVNTIPLWKNQMVISLGLEHTKQAVAAQNKVNETTNELLKKNAEMLHQTTVETAKESERAIVDLETLQHTHTELINTLTELAQIQKEGHEKRMAAEVELVRLEGELKQKMLEAAATQRA